MSSIEESSLLAHRCIYVLRTVTDLETPPQRFDWLMACVAVRTVRGWCKGTCWSWISSGAVVTEVPDPFLRSRIACIFWIFEFLYCRVLDMWVLLSWEGRPRRYWSTWTLWTNLDAIDHRASGFITQVHWYATGYLASWASSIVLFFWLHHRPSVPSQSSIPVPNQDKHNHRTLTVLKTKEKVALPQFIYQKQNTPFTGPTAQQTKSQPSVNHHSAKGASQQPHHLCGGGAAICQKSRSGKINIPSAFEHNGSNCSVCVLLFCSSRRIFAMFFIDG